MNKPNYLEIQNQYKEMDAWGLITSLDLHHCDPAIIRDADKIKEYVDEICKMFGFQKYKECLVVHFGENERVAGFSMIQLIETSLISGHFANLTNASYIDIFSCKAYDPNVAAEFSLKFFKASDYNVHIAIRK